jgi:hypothetical protein
VLLLPVSVVGGALSFGFFLGCGMIIRCEEKPRKKQLLDLGKAHISQQLPMAVPAAWKYAMTSGLRSRGTASVVAGLKIE